MDESSYEYTIIDDINIKLAQKILLALSFCFIGVSTSILLLPFHM